MIQIQEAFIARLLAAYAKQGPRSAGLMFARSKRAARTEATKQLAKLGYNETQIAQIIRDAHDMYVLERACSLRA